MLLGVYFIHGVFCLFFFFNSYLCVVLIPVHDKAFGLIALQALCVNLISFGKELHS